MVSIVNNLMTQWVGLSTDTKPELHVSNGSTYFEMDTGKTYYYDEENSQWVTSD